MNVKCLCILTLILSLGLSACREKVINPTTQKRVLLVYLAGDNSLSAETNEKLEAMRKGFKKGDGRILIYQDNNTSSKLMEIRADSKGKNNKVVVIREYPNENAASTEVFSRVIQQVINDYPAPSYGLLVFSHGSGWLPPGALQRPSGTLTTRSFIADNGTGRNVEMTITEFGNVLPNHKFDFIILEGCLMAGVEVAWELRNKTSNLLVSSAEIISPGFTPIYAAETTQLLNPELSPRNALIGFASAYLNDVSKMSDPSATLSIIDPSQMQRLSYLIREIHQSYQQSGTTPVLDLNQMQRFDRPGQYGDVPAATRFFDFGEYVHLLANADQRMRFTSIMNSLVIWSRSTPGILLSWANGNGFRVIHHSGLTTYVERPEFPYLNEEYRKTGWYLATK